MFGSFAAFVKLSILIAIAFIFLMAALAFAKNVYNRVTSTSIVQVAKFPDLAKPETDRGPYLLARAQELAKPVRLDALYEVKVPPLTSRFGLKDDLKFLDDVKINIQGVNLPEVIKNLFAAIPDDQPIVTAAPEPATSGSAARLEWKEPSGEKRSWLLQSNLAAADANATKQIVDQAIYAMVYYMYYDPAGPRLATKGVQFVSTRALEAYYSGQQHLGLYQQKLQLTEPEERKRQLSELDEAEQQFRILYQQMPHFVDGLMLLGVTLLEKNKEAEAVIIFERAKQILRQREATERALQPDEKKALFSAMLLHAIAQRKLYSWEDNHEALKELDQIKSDIVPLHTPFAIPAGPHAAPIPPEELANRLDFLKIHVSTLIEEAYLLGTYLVLLNEVRFVEALGRQDTPRTLTRSDARKAQIIAIGEAGKNAAAGAAGDKAREDRVTAFRDEMKEIYAAHRRAVSAAAGLIEAATQVLGPGDDAWRRARERFLSDLRNAEGYAQYRRAQAVEENDEKFRKECKDALAKLHEAYAVHQNEQSILLNLGLVEGDGRCDPNGERIERARKYLKDASEIRPKDYYAHQLLATLAIRQIYTFGPELTDPAIVTATVTAADEARRNRPGGLGSGTIFALLAQGYVLQLAQEKDTGKRADLVSRIEAAIAQAEKRSATPIHLHTARLQLLLQQASAAADDASFNKDYRKKLSDALDAAIAEAKTSPTWFGKQLLKDASALKKTLDASGDKKPPLRWPS